MGFVAMGFDQALRDTTTYCLSFRDAITYNNVQLLSGEITRNFFYEVTFSS